MQDATSCVGSTIINKFVNLPDDRASQLPMAFLPPRATHRTRGSRKSTDQASQIVVSCEAVASSGALRTSQRCRRRVLGRFAVHWEEITLRLRLSSCRGGMLSHNPTVDEHLPSPRVGIARKQKEIFPETYRLRHPVLLC